jgi:site-specific recombinase XerD
MYYGGFFMERILNAVDSILEFLGNIPLGAQSIGDAERHFRLSILPYCEVNGLNVFTDDDKRAYVEDLISKEENGDLSRDYVWRRRKISALLADCMHGRELVWSYYRHNENPLSEDFKKILDKFSASLSQTLAPTTVRTHISITRKLLMHIEQRGVLSISKLKPENIKDFITFAAPNHKSSMPKLTITIRKFLSHLADTGIVTINAERFLVNPAPRHRKLLPCFTDHETEAIFDAVDTSTHLGKRDYAIMMIALWTGLRSADIVNLKRQDIDWHQNVINVVQEKTSVCIRADLPPWVGNAIADYILNGRPETDCPHIFVRHRRPYGRLSPIVGKDVMDRHLVRAGIPHEAWDGKSFHAFRRTLGTRLVRMGMPLRSVGEMLGQLNADSSKRYIALDNEGLRVCCLSISELSTRKDGLK